jgi:hypothetical protein
MLRAFVSPHHDDWDQHLTAVEFAYNNSEHSSTGYSPFYLNTGDHPAVPLALAVGSQPSKNETANSMVQRMAEDMTQAKTKLAAAQERQKQHADAARRDHEFKPGDMVLLSRKFLRNQPASQVAGATAKLSAPNLGPFKVRRVINKVSCELELPENWKIHPVVHGSYLMPWRDGTQEFPERDPPPPDPDMIEEEEYWQLEAIRNHRWVGRRPNRSVEFLVKWVGWPEHRNTWEPSERLIGDADIAPQLIEEYRQRRSLPPGFYKSDTSDDAPAPAPAPPEVPPPPPIQEDPPLRRSTRIRNRL